MSLIQQAKQNPTTSKKYAVSQHFIHRTFWKDIPLLIQREIFDPYIATIITDNLLAEYDNWLMYAYLAHYYFYAEQDINKSICYLIYALSLNKNNAQLAGFYKKLVEITGKESLKIAFFYDVRVGHFCLEYLDYMLNHKEKSNSYTVFLCSAINTNNVLFKKFSVKLPILKNNLLHHLATSKNIPNEEYVQPLIGEQAFWDAKWHKQYGVLHQYYRLTSTDTNTRPNLISFDDAEEKYIDSNLKKMGLMDGMKSKYVCINARNNDYLIKTCSENNAAPAQNDNRNCDLLRYSEAVKYLIAKNIQVVIVGTHQDQRLSKLIPEVIDYSNDFRDNLNSELIDIALLTHCQFLICNHSGIGDISALNRIPLLVVNAFPIHPPFHKRDMYIPKILVNSKSQERRSYKDIYDMLSDSSIDDSEQLAFSPSLDIIRMNEAEYIENSAEDIFYAAKDMYKRSVLNKSFSKKQRGLIEKARCLIPTNHWLRDIDIPIAPSFIKNHLSFFA